MKLLFENWRKFLTEVDTDGDGIEDERELAIIDKGELPAETGRPDFEELKTVIREEIQAELLRSSKYGEGARPTAYGLAPTLWRVAQAAQNAGGGKPLILKHKIEKRFREEFPDQIIDKGYTLDIKGGRFAEFQLLISEVAKEVFELYELIKTLDTETETKVYKMIFATDGEGWVQALEMLRALQ